MTAMPTALVIGAHAADFVWRCGDAIALHAARGYDVTVLCLSFGERTALEGGQDAAAGEGHPPRRGREGL